MPIYEYRCGACNAHVEKLQKVYDAPITDCPECGQPRMNRVVSLAGFRLKGGGWYESDFKRDNRRNIAGDAPPRTGKEKKSGAAAEKTGGGNGSAEKSGSKGGDKAAADKAGN